MGFDEAATFSGGKNCKIQEEFTTCSLCPLPLPLASTCLFVLRELNMFTKHWWPCGNSSDIQKVLNLPELKIIKPSDTHWLAHERCVKAVKASYAAIVISLESIYEGTHEPEALGIGKAKSTLIAIFLLDFVLPVVAKLSKCLQAEKLTSPVLLILLFALSMMPCCLLQIGCWNYWISEKK